MDDRRTPGLEDDDEETGMDTTYVVIMTVVFLVVAALAVDIGYMYVSDEDLKGTAETSALAGAQAIKQRMLTQIQTDPAQLAGVVNDGAQTSAKDVAVDTARGKHHAAALVEVFNSNSNRLTADNDVTVGFWNMSTHTYTPGGAPVNAMQVRTRRTAESETIGLGSLGNFIAKISGHQNFNYTPDAIAAFPARASAHIALCSDVCDRACTYPSICSIPERKMSPDPANGGSAANGYRYTSLKYQPTGTTTLSDLVCMDMPPQEVCGKQIFVVRGASSDILRDMESMMYNPNADKTNKEYDPATGKLRGWWVIAPVTGCSPAQRGEGVERQTAARYALVRISRICVEGTTGCKQNNTAFDAPASVCDGANGLYIDRISCLDCGSQAMLQFPGLHPVLVK
ncbi:Tad domain-containing protein [Geomobilimonas luticola]|nr:Tad domain-containing protein [Geomobilimonas luticola]